MNKRHGKTLEAIFAQPISGNIKWRDVESLLKTLGAVLTERAGSRVSVSLNDHVIVLHRPHPSPNMDKGAVEIYDGFSKGRGLHYDRIQRLYRSR